MRIPTHWARGTYSGKDTDGNKRTFHAWGWSYESKADAEADAQARAERIFRAIVQNRQPDEYEYLEHPLREEILKSINTPSGEMAGVLTRNHYGAVVLNAENVCFVDIDFPPPARQSIGEKLLNLLSRERRAARATAHQDLAIQQVRQWAGKHADRSFRLYQTKAGLRLLFTDKLHDPTDQDTGALLKQLGSDTLYRKLTLRQGCFRARLTPKPWRCDWRQPPTRWPWANSKAEGEYKRWLAEYEKRRKGYTVCHLLDTVGQSPSDEKVLAIIHAHDSMALGDKKMALA